MPNENSTSVPSTMLFRSVAIMVLFLTVTVCALQVLGVVTTMQHPDPVTALVLFTPVVMTLIGGVALSALLEGITRLIHAQRPGEGSSSATIRLLTAIGELQAALPALIAQSRAQLPVQSEPVEASELSTALSSTIETHLERMIKLLEEMKEVSMLDETQRQSRRKQILARRKGSRLEEAARLINRQNWEEADALLHLLESLHPGDADVQACRHQLDDARIASQADVWEQLRQNVDQLLALSKYDEALAATSTFLDRFPTHTDCQQLALRVRHDAMAYTEAVSNRMYEQIKSAVEARQWRTAFDGIQRFLEQFPDHPRAAKIRNQMRVIQKNAEIEERHALEDHIRDLINAKQYAEAADQAEDLLARFPESPQAAYLTDLLPKLRERSGGVDMQGASAL